MDLDQFKTVWDGIGIILIIAAAALTLWGLGVAAKDAPYFWLAFIVNLGVYGVPIYKGVKKILKGDEE